MVIQRNPRNNSASEGIRRGHPVYDKTRAQPPDPERNHKNSRHGSESHNQLRNTRHPLSLALLEAPHGQMGRQTGHDTTLRDLLAMTNCEKELTITANTMLQGLHRHGLHDFYSPLPQLIDHIYGKGMQRDRKNENKNLQITGYEPYTNHQASVIPLLGGG